MEKKTVSAMMLTLLLISMLTLAFNIQLVKASGTIYIRADGSVDPPTAPIQRNGDTYTLTGNITADVDGIVIETDNIVLNGAGYTAQGTGGTGITLSGRTNVTIQNTTIKAFIYGIYLNSSSNNNIVGNDITNNGDGIYLNSSSNNNIVGNDITNNGDGIYLNSSSNNNIVGNNITNNGDGIYLNSSSNNNIVGNNITANGWDGIHFDSSSNNNIVGNDITNNGDGIWLFPSCSNNVLKSNALNNNDEGLCVWGESLSEFVQDIDVSNTVNGKPVYYWVNETDKAVPADAGYVALVNCTGITVQNLSLSENGQGILLAHTTNTTITKNSITNNMNGICLVLQSSNNSINGNNITANINIGIYLDSSWNNSIDGNNIGNNIAGSGNGITLNQSWNNSIAGNNVTANNYYGILLSYCCSYNSIAGNNVTANNYYGILLSGSSCFNNSIAGNNIANSEYGIYLQYHSSNNSIDGNNITDNWQYGIWIDSSSSSNSIFHNNFVNNTQQAYSASAGSTNVWDDGYPSGGNYWSDYTGVDEKSGPYQDQPGSDGIGDTPYVIDASNRDRYPLMAQYYLRHDITVTAVAPSKTVVGQGYSLNINVTAANKGDFPEFLNVTLYANTTAVAKFTSRTLLAGASVTIPLAWNTTGFAKGNYTISAAAEVLPGETDTTNNNMTDGMVLVTLIGDVNGDRKVRIDDILAVATAFGSNWGEPKYSPNLDINDDRKIRVDDVLAAATHFGQGPW